MKLTSNQLNDLSDLAITRCSMAVDTVNQLIEDPEQMHHVLVAVLCSMTVGTAVHQKEHTDGNASLKTHYFHVLTTLARYGETRDLDELIRQQNQ